MDSLGVGAIETGRKYVPDHRQHRQEVPPGNASVVVVFLSRILAAEGVLGPPLFVPYHPTWVGGLKGQEPWLWFLHPRVFWHFLCLQHLETSQGVLVDSLGVGAVEIGRIFAPDHRRRRQEALKHYLTTPAWFSCFRWGIVDGGGGIETPSVFHATPE